MTLRNELDLERDLLLDSEDRAPLQLAWEACVNPAEMQWQWISFALQFPGFCPSRETAVGREEFRLPSPR